MMDKIPDGSKMVCQLCRKGRPLSNQTGNPLLHGIIKPFNAVRFTVFFSERAMSLGRDNCFGAIERKRMESRMSTDKHGYEREKNIRVHAWLKIGDKHG